MAKQNPLHNKLKRRDEALNGPKTRETTPEIRDEDSIIQAEPSVSTETISKRKGKTSSFKEKMARTKKRSVEPSYMEEPIVTSASSKEYEEELETEALLAERKASRREKQIIRARKVGTIILSVLCVYLLFTIFGAINTNYVYDDTGKVVPQQMTITRKQALNEFDKVALQYRQARALYEKVLLLDYRIGAGVETPMEIAPEYDAMLTSIEELNIQLKAVNVSAEYTQTLSKLNDWTYTDLPVYCQSISKAIQQNDEESANKALAFREAMYNDFSQVTQMILSLAERVEGAEVGDILTWSPESYITEATGGM